jgi:hypothetical protein
MAVPDVGVCYSVQASASSHCCVRRSMFIIRVYLSSAVYRPTMYLLESEPSPSTPSVK